MNVVFIGCGGTFWAGMPGWLSVLSRVDRAVDFVLLVDGDRIAKRDLQRQWVWERCNLGRSKAAVAGAYVMDLSNYLYLRTRTVGRYLRRGDPGLVGVHAYDRPTIVVQNVDNDASRLVGRALCQSVAAQQPLHDPIPVHVVQIVTGCERNEDGTAYGQVHVGVWGDGGRIVHDWNALHRLEDKIPGVLPADLVHNDIPEVLRTAPCGGQTIADNCLTAALAVERFATATRMIVDDTVEDDETWQKFASTEVYWRGNRSWTQQNTLHS